MRVDDQCRSCGLIETDGVEADASNVRSAAGGDQDFVGCHDASIGECDGHMLVAGDVGHPDARTDIDAFTTQDPGNQLAALRLLWSENPVEHLDDRDCRPKPGERLSKLQSDRTTAYDDHGLRTPRGL